MMNIKDYVMSRVQRHPANNIFIFVYFEVVNANEIINSGELAMNLKVSDVENKTEQEIKRIIADIAFRNTYISVPVPDKAKVYLYINGRPYLIEDEYRPELYY